MASLIKFGESGAHWYHQDGRPQHDADLRVARKELLMPSVSSIDKDQFVNPALDNWKKGELVEACINSPRQPHESIEEYAQRVYEASLEKARVAAEFGQKLHDELDNYPNPVKKPEFAPWVTFFDAWWKDNIEESIASECTLLDHELGVAGRTDRIVRHKIHGRCVVDYKTQGLKPDDKGRKKPRFYDSWPRQLSFYASCDAKLIKVWPHMPACISLVIDSTEAAPPYMKVWTPEEIKGAYHDFVVATNAWCRKRNYWPVGEWTLTPSVSMPS